MNITHKIKKLILTLIVFTACMPSAVHGGVITDAYNSVSNWITSYATKTFKGVNKYSVKRYLKNNKYKAALTGASIFALPTIAYKLYSWDQKQKAENKPGVWNSIINWFYTKLSKQPTPKKTPSPTDSTTSTMSTSPEQPKELTATDTAQELQPTIEPSTALVLHKNAQTITDPKEKIIISQDYFDSVQKQNDAATIIQKVFRGNKVRQEIENLKAQRARAASTIQRMWRSAQAREELKNKKYAATTLLQRSMNQPKRVTPKSRIFDVLNLKKELQKIGLNHFIQLQATMPGQIMEHSDLKPKPETVSFPNFFPGATKDTVLGINTYDNLGKSEEELTQEILEFTKSIRRGARYAYQLVFNKTTRTIPHGTRQEYLQSIIDIHAFLYSQCFTERSDGKGFVEGTFFIESPELKTFLKNYFKATVNENGVKNYFAYTRDNSHGFKDSFGIDTRFEANEDCKQLLFKFGHFLVGFSEDGDGVWLKPEKVGCSTWSDTLTHGAHFVEAQGTKIASKLFGTKGDDADHYSKERVPLKEKRAFEALFPDCAQKNKTLGFMHSHALQNSDVEGAQKLANNLKKTYSHIKKRHGREIFLTQDELLSAYFVQTHDTCLIGFFKKFLDLKKAINKYKNGNYEFAEQRVVDLLNSWVELSDKQNAYNHLVKHIQEFNRYFDVIRNLITDRTIKNYFVKTATLLKVLTKDDNGMETLALEPVFESDWQNEQLRENKKINKKLVAQIAAMLEQFNQSLDAHLAQFEQKFNLQQTKPQALKGFWKKIEDQELQKTIAYGLFDEYKGLLKTNHLRALGGNTNELESLGSEQYARVVGLVNTITQTNNKQARAQLIKLCKHHKNNWKQLEPGILNMIERTGRTTNLSNKDLLKIFARKMETLHKQNQIVEPILATKDQWYIGTRQDLKNTLQNSYQQARMIANQNPNQ